MAASAVKARVTIEHEQMVASGVRGKSRSFLGREQWQHAILLLAALAMIAGLIPSYVVHEFLRDYLEFCARGVLVVIRF